MDQPPFRCTVPNRMRSALISLGSFAIATAFFFIPAVGWVLFLFPAAFAVLFLLTALLPGRFLTGIALSERGFEFRAPLRTPRLIPFTSIRRIEAFCRGDGEYGEAVHFLIHANAGKVLVTEDVLIRSGLHDILVSLPAFDRDALRDAAKYEPRGLDLLFGRRFTIYESTQA